MLNGEATSQRVSPFLGLEVAACPFCGEASADNVAHRDTCPTLVRVRGQLCDYDGDVWMLSWSWVDMWLQTDMEGNTVMRELAYLSAVTRIRRVLLAGLRFHDINDLCSHFKRLVVDPWLAGSGRDITKAQRRRLRSKPPSTQADWVIYASDGAARNQGSADNMSSSCGAVRYTMGTLNVQACCGRALGEVSNNVAEYNGLLDALEHALLNPGPKIEFRVDSKLLAMQVSGRWRCRARSLQALYERSLRLLGNLRAAAGVQDVELLHVYREYNGDADGICNEILDMQRVSPDRHGFAINRNWLRV